MLKQSPSWESYVLIQRHPRMTCKQSTHGHKEQTFQKLVKSNEISWIFVIIEPQLFRKKKRKTNISKIAYPPDKIWLRQKSPSSFDSKLQSRRTISRPLRSITCKNGSNWVTPGLRDLRPSRTKEKLKRKLPQMVPRPWTVLWQLHIFFSWGEAFSCTNHQDQFLDTYTSCWPECKGKRLHTEARAFLKNDR